MPELIIPDLKRYYSLLEIVYIALVTTMMLLFGLIFAGNPNLSVFSTLHVGEIYLTPIGFAVFCIAFAVACPFILASPWIKRKAATWRQSASVIITAPILLYLMIVFGTSFPNNLNASLVYYASNYLLMILTPLALYQGYKPGIERISTAVLIAIHVFSALFMLINPSLMIFDRFNSDWGTGVTPIYHAIISILCAIGYGLLLAPLPNFSCRRRRFYFVIFEMPIFLVFTLWIYNAWRMTGALSIAPAAFFNLALLIAVLGFALCPTGRRRLIGIPGDAC